MEIEDRWKRLKKEVEKELGTGDIFSIKIKDGEWFVTLERVMTNYPTNLQMHEMIDRISEWRFGGVKFTDGEGRQLVEYKCIKI